MWHRVVLPADIGTANSAVSSPISDAQQRLEHWRVLPADIGKASTLLVPISQFAVPVDGPRGDAQVPFSGHRGTGVSGLAAPGCVQNPTWLS